MLKTIYNLFKKKFIAYAFADEESKAQMIEYVFKNQPSKPKQLNRFKTVFIDSQGKRYFIPESEIEFGIGRLSVFQKYNDFLQAGISYQTLQMVCDVQESIFNQLRQKHSLETIKEGEKTTEALRSMINTPLHAELLFLVAATFYIREDEDPNEVDSEIEAQKVAEFKKYSTGELYSFFYQTPLKELLDLYGITDSNLGQYLSNSMATVKETTETLQYLTLQKKREKSMLKD